MAQIDLKNQATMRIVFCLLLAGGALGVFFFTHFVPFGYRNRQDALQSLKADYERKSTELARARASVADLPRFEAEYEQLHTRWAMAAELLPADREGAALLRKITLAGQQTGVQFVTFRPGSPKNETYYTETPVDIVVHGGYHQIGSFLAELANLRRIVTVSNVKLVTAPQNDYGATAAASFSASAYSLNATPAPVSAPGSTSASPAAKDKKGASNGHQS
jgi:Tfp pilus assembly protein PilO